MTTREKLATYAKMMKALYDYGNEIKANATDKELDLYELQFEEIAEIAYRLDTSSAYFE
jgi:hypothetical protein